MKQAVIEPNLVYLFTDDRTYYAATRAKFPGLDEVYGYGWKIEPDPKKTKNPVSLQRNRAKRNARVRIENTLNAINMYGKDVLDKDGNVDWERFQLYDRLTTLKGTSKSGIAIPIDILKPVTKFKVKDISMDEAIEMGLF